jgi:hypothetical protein
MSAAGRHPRSRPLRWVVVAVLAAWAVAPVGGTGQAAGAATRWIGAWGAAPTDADDSFSNQTLRLNLTPLHSGTRARVRVLVGTPVR